ncbi:MAG: SDR family oxidoreductase [Hyphomicrobiaceae bacterium]|nr:SDR family oxidoreductase [Hyphomicrobiaceae bacterium]
MVTGAGSGIGRAVALALQGDGYNVALAGRRAAELEATKAMARAGGGEMLVDVTDVSDPLSVKSLFQATVQAFGRVDVLFNNAGIFAPPSYIEDMPVATWRQMVDVNLSGVIYCCQEAIRVMKRQAPKGGRIINNGSISAMTPRPLSSAYTTTKHAITGLTKSIALEGRGHNIACGQIDIGNATTAMTEPMAKGQGALQADGSKKVEPRMDVAHVASAVLYMANLPLDTNVLSMTIKATEMPFEGRG